MKKLRVYEYGGCSTCRKALRFLKSRKVEFVSHDITLNPPSLKELKEMLKYAGDLHKLFNTSGQVYREMRLSEKLHAMSQEDALGLLAANGKLVKRPFILGEGWGLLGFKEDEWKKRI